MKLWVASLLFLLSYALPCHATGGTSEPSSLEKVCIDELGGEIQVNCRTRINQVIISSGSFTLLTGTQLNLTTGTLNSFMVVGTTTNDNAPAGRIGEYVESVVGSVGAGLTTVYKDLTSISLTAGDWDVTGITIWDVPQAATTDIECIVSVTSGNSTTGATVGSNWTYYSTASGNLPAQGAFSISSYRLSLNTTTTVYLKGRVDRSSGSPVFDGSRLSARRVR